LGRLVLSLKRKHEIDGERAALLLDERPFIPAGLDEVRSRLGVVDDVEEGARLYELARRPILDHLSANCAIVLATYKKRASIST